MSRTTIERGAPPGARSVANVLMLLALLGGLLLQPAVRAGEQAGESAGKSISLPDCSVIEGLAAGLDATKRVPINRWVQVQDNTSGLTLTAAVAAPAFADAFGKAMLNWTRADLSLFNPAIRQCMDAASDSQRPDAENQLVELRRVVQFHMSQPLNAVNRARQEVPDNLALLEALPTSVEKLRIYALLSRLQELSQSQGASEVRRPIEQMRHAGTRPGRLVVGGLHNLPQAEADEYFRRIDGARDVLIEEVMADLDGQLASAPGSLAGLVAVDQALAAAESELTGSVPPNRLAALGATAQQARQRVWTQLEQALQALPDTAEGALQLNGLTSSLEYRELNPEDRSRLNEQLGERREQMADAAIRGHIDQLTSFPATLDGLRDQAAFAGEVRAELSTEFAPRGKQAFEDAYFQSQQMLAAAAKYEFSDYLAGVPETPEGVEQITALLREIDAPVRGDLYVAGLARARQIANGIGRARRQQQCGQALADLPLDEVQASQPAMGVDGRARLLGELLCDIALAGGRVQIYESAELSGADHAFQVIGRDGVDRTYYLNRAPAGQAQDALVGVRVQEPTGERALSVAEWRATLASLLPSSNAPRDVRCAQLMSTPEDQLSAEDGIEAVSCLMGGPLGR